jgi:hypothetical protein
MYHFIGRGAILQLLSQLHQKHTKEIAATDTGALGTMTIAPGVVMPPIAFNQLFIPSRE